MGEGTAENGARFRILGSFECWDGPDRVRVGGPVHERVLVTLLLEPQRVLPVFRLVEAVWDDNAPATAAHQVRKAVAELRQRIPDGRNLIVTEGPGYRALTTLEQVDLSRFTEGLRQAREATAAGQGSYAATALREALDLWRGPLLSGSGGSVLSAASAALEERRLTAVEQLFDLRLAAGETGELVGELREFIEANPLRETLRGQLMLALFRSGRQAEALEEFTKVREFLVDELGIGPGDALTDLHHAILRNSPELAAPAQAAGPTPLTPEGSPSTLPYDLGDFTGRQEEVRQLLGYVEEAPGAGPLIVAIDGMGGSGKTSLAVRAAHQLTDRYPDAQLHIDLRGFTPGEQPLSAGAAAEALLRMLGAPGDRIPDDAEGRIALWRRTMGSRRMILLLDNAVDESQIRPLLASPTQSLVLVTSRALLVDLDAAHTVSLGVMPPHDSVALIEGVLGNARARAEPEAVAQLAELCGHLPLALRIAAARLRKRPRWTVRYLVDRLRDDAHRLAELSSGERSVEVTLRLSYEGLPAETREAFRLLGQHPGAEIEVYAAGALLDKRARDAEDVLEYLLDMHLLQQHETGRYAFHDLVRSFAQNLSRVSGRPSPETGGGDAGAGDEEAARAVRRLLDFALSATDVACDLLFPGRVRIRRPAHQPPAELPPLKTPEQAREWLEREQDSLLAAVFLAFRWELDTHVGLLAANVAFPLDLRGRLEEFRELSRTAVTASRRLGDPGLLRLSLSNLAVACWKLGRFEEGMEVSEEAFGLAVDLADRRGEAKDTGVLGLLLSALGRYAEALPRLEQSIAIKRELGAERAEAESLTNLSNLYAECGRFPEAVEAATRAVTLSRGIGAVDKEVEGLTDLAVARLGLGSVGEAADLLRRARKLALDVVSPADMSLLLALSAEAADRLGDSGQAAAWAESALRVADLSGAPMREAAVSNIVGRLHARSGGYSRALELHQRAQRAASGVGYRIEEARALAGMAHALEHLGEHESARVHRSTADEAFDAMGIPTGRRA
ncbi:BTAD domain-containing putative transcriptional regulator [Streptomyces sp. 549]|uniref:AfsR/SARP family transcriptional regulator n=1 Tax=Streptomyces sp. 549 TaxID=3049076 RepID=UPI0024C419A7|nr:BTAD domain-containing putative transcriptional regulator [Streptomyces sp. 549]MDK1475891.1 BTAD domain-containing putative transcriptional regulator [Streptomyces sp. 549]